MGTFRETLFEGNEGLPKDIYTLINHYNDAKDIWDNVKMLLEGSELTKEDHELQLYDDFEHFHQHKGETIHDYYVWFAKLINDMQNIKMTMSRMQLNSKFVNNTLPEWSRFVTTVKLNRGLRDSNYDQLYAYLKQHEAHANENKMMRMRVALDEEQLLFIASGQDNAVDEDVDEQLAPPAQAMFMANLSSADPVYDEVGLPYDSDILSEVHDHDHYQDAVCEQHKVHEMHDDVPPNYIVDSHADYTSDSNMISYDHLRDKDLQESKDPHVVVSAAKLPILNPNEFDLWKMRIEQYFLMTDYSLWEVILNGDSPIPTRVIDGVVQLVAPTTAEQRLARKNELKARGTLLMDLPDKHQITQTVYKYTVQVKIKQKGLKKSLINKSGVAKSFPG
nr:integrase, catalytic region, zinc finger, CCHC-type, peptidase aspartic, catalytic [Tanacetum cinerariifolium]